VKSLVFAASLLSLVGCGKNIDNKEAVKTAIVKRVSKTGFDVKTMQVDVTNVSFHDQDAVATVSFTPTGGPPQSAVTFKYNLHKQNDEWVATGLAQGGAGSDMGAHTGVLPQGGSAPAGSMPVTPGALPPADPSKPLPPGHPPIGKQK
jgi:hypothetical protein